MKLTNTQIYNYSSALNAEFNNCNIKLPVKVNFFLQKNIQTLSTLFQEIEEARMNIAKSYGEYEAEKNAFNISPDKIALAQKDLEELFVIEQEVQIRTFKLDDFADIELTYKQMNALMFMIED